MADEDFDRYVEKFFRATMERHPVVATFIGLHEYDHLLSENSRQFFVDEVNFLRDHRKRFKAFEPQELSGSRPLDRELALYLFDLELFKLEEMRQWESLPNGAEGLGEALFPLFTRDFAPLDQRLGSITARLEMGPRYLEGLKTRISRPVKLWTEMALEASERLPSFVNLIYKTAEGKASKDTLTSLGKAIQESQAALEEYEEWLREDVLPRATEAHILGEERFRRLLELRHLGYRLEEVRDLGLRYLQETKEELRDLARRIDPQATVEEVSERIKANHPGTFNEVLETVRRAIDEARSFVKERQLATLPPTERLTVTETPTFLRPILPFAAYFPPAKFDRVQEGVYVVTPPEDGHELLREHNHASIRNTAVHEGYPGHHLQLSAANLNPSLLRQLTLGVSAAETVEGWAHYCEDMMQETGFSDLPEVRFIQLQDIIWRACRIVIDVDLHCGRMSFEEAVEMLVREVGMEKSSAVAEVKRYTQYPTYQLSYLLGKHLIKALREEVERRMGDRFSYAFFHDTILYSGSLPFFLLRRVVEDKLSKLEEGVEDLY
ncbi:MAG: DUF885 domain-containing protein [Thermoplasmata archaeon]